MKRPTSCRYPGGHVPGPWLPCPGPGSSPHTRTETCDCPARVRGGGARGVVQIVGTASHAQFQRYELYYAPWPVPSDNAWIFIGPDAHFQQQPLGLLGTWDSRAVPDGSYALHVRVVKQDGNYNDSEARRVTVANTKPAETPTPSESPTPTGSPTPSTPTATLPAPTAAAVSTVPPTNRATVAPAKGNGGAQVTVTPGTPAPVSSDSSALISSAGDALNPSRLGKAAKSAVTYTLLILVLAGLFFGVKALLYRFWQRMRP